MKSLITKFQIKRMVWNKKYFLLLMLFTIINISNANAKSSQKDYSIFSENIKKSYLMLDQETYKPIRAVSKIWFETLGGQRRFINYFFSEVSLDGNIYFQNIPILDNNGKSVEISDWDSADCIIKKFILYKKDDSIYLLTSSRIDGFPKPQNEPSKQKIVGYLLTTSDEIGKSPIFFKQVFILESSKTICSAHEVNILFHNAFLNFTQGE